MPPFPPIVHDEIPQEAAQFVRWLGRTLECGRYSMEITDSSGSDSGFGLARLVIEGSWVFQIGDKVFTIWEDKT